MAMAQAIRQSARAAMSGTMRVRHAKNRGWYFRALERQRAAAEAEALPPFPETPIHGRARPRAFIDFAVGGSTEPIRVEFELADDIAPKTVHNFLQLCSRAEGKGYKGSVVHRVRKHMGLEFGDFVNGDGTGGCAAVSETGEFEDESFAGRHSVPGTLTMCNHGVDTNNSVVFVSNRPMPHLDGRFVVFGRVVAGLGAINDLSNVFSVRLRPVDPVRIVDCGEVRA